MRQLLYAASVVLALLTQGGLTFSSHGSLRDEIHETKAGVDRINLAIERLDSARSSNDKRVESIESRLESERQRREDLAVKVQALEVELARRKG